MKTSENFKRVIQDYLNNMAQNDTRFAESLNKENKSLDQCINYILNQVKQSGLNGFEDAEIFGMAVHYYDEDTIEDSPNIQCQIVTNHHVKLSDDEIAQAKQKALESIIASEKTRITTKVNPANPKQPSTSQINLF
jgi:SOS response regulatory protein OraA/RecX